jgi:hypothetical protein
LRGDFLFIMFQKITALILLIAFAVHTFNRVVIVFGFYANQQEISATLCENKDKPILKCEGKCQLAKKLQAQEKKDQQNPERKAENKPGDISSRSFFSSISAFNLINAAQWEKSRDSGKPIHRNNAVFHPPIFTIHLG